MTVDETRTGVRAALDPVLREAEDRVGNKNVPGRLNNEYQKPRVGLNMACMDIEMNNQVEALVHQ